MQLVWETPHAEKVVLICRRVCTLLYFEAEDASIGSTRPRGSTSETAILEAGSSFAVTLDHGLVARNPPWTKRSSRDTLTTLPLSNRGDGGSLDALV
jgi:hypothetical protein